ncbi:MAG: hypothetical protein L7U42_00675 [Candidatus Nanopelagicales bacterium]|nr:hypothetical protein [Candidatus Nanopelagicales bacterium]
MKRTSLAARLVLVWLALSTEWMESKAARMDLTLMDVTQAMSSRGHPVWMARAA